MSQQNPPPPSSPADTAEAPRTGGPRVSSDQMRDVDRLRRSSTDRYVAGVAGGLGRHFDLDPTVIRVTLVVLTLFGGAGALIYGAVWLFVPEDGKDKAAIDVHGDLLKVLLVVVAVLALSMVFGTPFFGGWGVPVPLLVLLLVGVAIYATRQQRKHPGPPPAWPTSASAAPPEGTTMTVTDQPPGAPGYRTTDPAYGEQPPAWGPPSAPAYVPPPRPRRTGPVLFWPTLALIAIGLGSLGIYDISGDVVISAYAALALVITGAMLVLGAFRGRPGGLIALGIASTLALLITSIVASASGHASSADTVRFAPLSAETLNPSYSLGAGDLELDLTRISDPQLLAGKVVAVHVGVGEMTVLVPNGVDVHIEAEVRFVGEININGEHYEGLGQSVSSTLPGASAPDGAAELELTLTSRVGQINVEQR